MKQGGGNVRDIVCTVAHFPPSLPPYSSNEAKPEEEGDDADLIIGFRTVVW